MRSQTVLKLMAVGAGAFWLTEGVRWLRGMRRLPTIDAGVDSNTIAQDYDSCLAVVVPVRDEIRTLGEGLGSCLASAPEGARIVAVDDRSTDGSSEALDRMAAADPRLTVLHLSALPAGWLGKNHALHAGARAARGLWGCEGRPDAWLLFTDADVVYQPGAVAATVRYAEENGLDHLTVWPRLEAHTFLEKVFVATFTFVLAIAFRMWEVNDARARGGGVGLGAFNLVRAGAYDRMGGHERLRLEVADDVRLGQRLRASGARQGLASGTRLMSVRWQHSLRGLIEGLEKNAFAGVYYSVPRLLLATVGLVLLCEPYAGVLLSRGWARRVHLLALGVIARLFYEGQRRDGLPWPYFATLPIGVALFLVALWRSALLCLWRGGIVWRDTFYPLSELRGETAGLQEPS